MVMRTVLLLALGTVAAMAADNSWDKVRELKTGVELRILKKGTRQPVLGTMDEANDERVILVVKNEEIAIQKDDIDRLDYRPATKSSARKETHTTESNPSQAASAGPQPKGSSPGASTSTTTSFGSGSKPDFETIYRRTAK